MEIPKVYDPKNVEDRIYKLWEESGFFAPENLPDRTKGNFVSTIAPPNITGELHMGHALELTSWDIVMRMRRMQGYKVLWLPGTDHASIGTSVVIEKQLAKEGLTRHKIGREEFLKRAWAWREKYGTAILSQFKKLGLSLDWTRTKFTMDPGYNKAVETAFHHYYKKGWIYKGERVINWCPRCSSSVSDLEVNYVPEKGNLYYIKYGPFTLATARPETKLGDTALAVHPADERYKKYIGKDLEIESVNNTIPKELSPKKKIILIKVVADEAVDKDFGTGIIKVTPAHDFTDAEIGQRHSLFSIKIIDERGRMNEQAGVRYEGMKVSEAREQIIKDLQELGLMEKVEEYDHNVGRCERCNTVIEPLPSKQWFLKMGELAKLAREAVEKKEVKFHPERWTGPVLQWLDKIRDWNISRQLWWGHKIPIEGEEDVLDTWFSSALWPFASLGWPDKTKDFKKYYPTSFITSARDILFLWQLRMIFSGKELTGTVPFEDIYIHATVMTKDGKRMSKSLGTGINPIDLIEKYGTDAVRFGIAYQVTDLQDMRFSEDALLMGKKFANKFWNIARYVITKTRDQNFETTEPAETEIVKKFKEVAASVTKDINNYQFGQAAHSIYDFVWHDFADKYIEETKSKEDEETKQTLAYLLVNSLKVLHPFMPFITEEIWSKLPLSKRGLLMVEKWPHTTIST